MPAQNSANPGRSLDAQDLRLLELLLARDGAAVTPGTEAIGRRPEGEAATLSFGQQRLWFLRQWQPDSAAYNIPLSIRLSGALKLPALEAALRMLLQRHEVLRCRFVPPTGSPRTDSAAACRIEVEAVAGDGAAQREAAAQRRLLELARRPIALESEGPLAVSLLRLQADVHLLLLNLHHIAVDAESVDLLLVELGQAYGSCSLGRPARWPALALQYADFAAWQRQTLQGERLAGLLEQGWRQLADATPLALHTDRPRPPVQSLRGGRLPFSVAAGQVAALRRVAAGEGVTLFMLLLAALAVVLQRHSGQHDLLVGTPTSQRSDPALRGVVGLFVNLVVLRLDLGGEPTCRQLLARVRDTALAAFERQELPFEKLVEHLQPERDASRAPLVQVVFDFHERPAEVPDFGEIEAAAQVIDTGTAKFDLALSIEKRGPALFGDCQYASELFEPASMQRLLQHYERLLQSLAEAPLERRIGELEWLTAAERAALLERGRPRPEVLAAGEGRWVHQRIEDQARQRGAAVAVVDESGELSYEQLQQQSGRVAGWLLQQGAGPEQVVGVLLDREAGLVVAMLGVLRSGAAYLPLDSAAPVQRRALLLADAGVRLLVSRGELARELRQSPARLQVLDLDELPEQVLQPLPAAPVVDSAQLAYVIHTSGSSGQPKGVMVSHGALARLFDAGQPRFGFDETDVWSLFHASVFDFSVWEMWGALVHGGRLAVVPYWVSRTPEAFHEWLCEQGVTVLNQTPSAFQQLMAAAAMAARPARALRWIIFGGESLELASLRPWFRQQARLGGPAPRLVNMYGITETTVHVSWRELQPAEVEQGQGSLIGQPLPDLGLYLLDEQLRPVPDGVTGELCVGGAGVARGYLGQPALTAQRFVPDPCGGAPGARLYRSGDLARVRGDGELQYLGRSDQQLKLRGHRIEPGEVQAALLRCEGVAQAEVLARQDGAGHGSLVAYVVAAGGTGPGLLRRQLRQWLPAYMVPAQIVLLERLPLTRQGKLDRARLPAPAADRPALEEPYEAPRNEAESALVQIWQQVLGVQQVGIHDNFFALGGDSIRSLQVLAAARARGLLFGVQELFERPAIAPLVAALPASPGATPSAEADAASARRAFDSASSAERRQWPPGVVDAYPLSALQLGMLYHMRLEPHLLPYHNVDSWHLQGRFDALCFERALQRIVDRHPILRTGFDLASFAEPMQLVYQRVSVSLPVHDLCAIDDPAQQAVISDYIDVQSRAPFDLARPPLLRWCVHRRAVDRFQLSLTECHAVLDGWSLLSTLNEVFDLYGQLLLGEDPPPAPTPASSYRDFVARERQAAQNPDSRRFWQQRLAEQQATTLPPAWHAAPGTPPGFNTVETLLPAALCESLLQVAQAAQMPLKSVLLAAHLKVLALVGGSEQVVTGLTCNGRLEEPGGDEVRGLFLNTPPLCARVGPGSWRALINAAFAEEQRLLPHRRYPTAQIQRDLRQGLLYETSFNYTHFHAIADQLRGAGLGFVDARIGADPQRRVELTNFLLVAGFLRHPLSSQVLLALDHDGAKLDVARVRELARGYVAVLEAIARNADAPHHQFCLLTPQQRRQQLVDWNATQQRFERGVGLHELVRRQALRHADAPALEFEGQVLRYGELLRRARRLAQRLRALGVGSEARVGLCMERSLALPVALLAVLEAGAAYVALEPATPPQRLRHMLQDARVQLVLAEGEAAQAAAVAQRALPPPLALRWLWLAADGGPAGELVHDIAADGDPGPALPAVDARQLAYLLYTSGSTGRPKGVMVTHEAIVNRLQWMQQAYALQPGQRVLHKTPIGFDVSVWELFWPLLQGAVMVLARPGGHRDSAYLVQLIAQRRISHVHFVPSMLGPFLAEPQVQRCAGVLQALYCSGEALSAQLSQRCRSLLGVEVHNLYGPTEAAVDVTAWRCGELPGRGGEPIGRPIANVQTHVLDTQMQLVPVGVAGELYLGGLALARGYQGQPALTAERFVPDPCGATAGGRLYRTGDRVRWREDGVLEYLGRLDGQLKIRGQRVEPAEVEAVLLEQPAVQQAAVVGRELAPGHGQLLAYLVVGAGFEGVAALQQRLRQRLPEAMRPAHVELLAALPLTGSGKLDRRRLPAPTAAPQAAPAVAAAPGSPLQRDIARTWAEVLRRPDVGIDDNFFDVGGDSLMLAQVHARLRQGLHLECTLPDLLRHPTVRRLADWFEQAPMPPAAARPDAAARLRRLEGLRQRRGPAARPGDHR